MPAHTSNTNQQKIHVLLNIINSQTIYSFPLPCLLGEGNLAVGVFLFYTGNYDPIALVKELYLLYFKLSLWGGYYLLDLHTLQR